MKNRITFLYLPLILVIFSLFPACSDPTKPEPTYPGSTNPGPTNPGSTNPEPTYPGSTNPKPTYTVNFEANGGSPAPDPQSITQGGKVVQPPAMTKTGYTFGGWYKESACTNQWYFATDTVTDSVTLYAKWELPIVVPGDTLYTKLQWLGNNAKDNSAYILEITADEYLSHQSLSFTGKSNITIQLKGIGGPKVIALSSAGGSLFNIGSGITLILEENIILSGISDNSDALVQVSGTLIMNQGAKIINNTSSRSSRYAISLYGGGVYVSGAGTFTMSGGEISGNTVSSTTSNSTAYHNSFSYGGGVYVIGTFTMSGGKISGNTASSFMSSSDKLSSSNSYGGGVYVMSAGTFTMSGGEISGNTASSSSSVFSDGGGVYVSDPGTFTMSGGKISGNTAYCGGGVYVMSGGDGTFTMSGGEISGNTASYGGGVEGALTMNGGEISGNTAYLSGGGVYAPRITKSGGGTITGYVSDTVNGNVVKVNGAVQSNSGHAVYVSSYFENRRESTAGPGDNLDSNKSGAAGGWE